jgi:hypothetical protein
LLILQILSQSDDDTDELFHIDRFLPVYSCRTATSNVHVQGNLKPPLEVIESLSSSSSTAAAAAAATAVCSLTEESLMFLHFTEASSDVLDSNSFLNSVTTSVHVEEEGVFVDVVDGFLDEASYQDVDERVYNALALAIELHEVLGWSQSDSAAHAKISRRMLQRYLISTFLFHNTCLKLHILIRALENGIDSVGKPTGRPKIASKQLLQGLITKLGEESLIMKSENKENLGKRIRSEILLKSGHNTYAIAEDASMSDRTVRRCTQEMKEMGLLGAIGQIKNTTTSSVVASSDTAAAPAAATAAATATDASTAAPVTVLPGMYSFKTEVIGTVKSCISRNVGMPSSTSSVSTIFRFLGASRLSHSERKYFKSVINRSFLAFLMAIPPELLSRRVLIKRKQT